MTTYRGMDKAALDAGYNNRNAAKNVDERIAGWKERSTKLRAELNVRFDLAYGATPRERIDLYLAGAPNAPTLIYIHGGYWQSNDKEGYGFITPGLLSHGINVAVIEYTLAPEAKMDRIVGEVRRAVDWLAAHIGEYGGDPQQLYVSGHSAGGHLTATVIDHPAIRGGMAISGLFDLEPIRLCYLNDALGMDKAEAEGNSPILHLPAKAAPLIVTVGAMEQPELVRQSADYYAAWIKAGLTGSHLPLADHEHFSILEELAAADGKLAAAVLGLMKKA